MEALLSHPAKGRFHEGAFIPGEIIVLFVTGTPPGVAQAIIAQLGGTVLQAFGELYLVGVPVGEEEEFVDLFNAVPEVAAAQTNGVSCSPALPACTCCPPIYGCPRLLACGLQEVELLADRAGPDPADVLLVWSPGCDTWAEDYAIYEGQIGAFYSHSSAGCSDTATRFEEVVTASFARSYFLVVPRYVSVEGSYGPDSSKIERPAAGVPCSPGQNVQSCP